MAMILSFLGSHSQVYMLKERLKGSYAALGTSDNMPIGVASTEGFNYVAIQANLATKRDLVIQKVDQSTGATVWIVTNSNTSSIDPACIIADASSNVLVLGNIANTSGRSDIHLVKYNSSGVRTLEITYTDPLYSYEVGQKVQVDNSGNIYILGYGYNAATQKTDMVFLKYSSTGVLKFAINYSSEISNSFNQLTIDPLRNSIYIGGGANNKMVILSYNLTGTKLWEANYNGPRGMFSSPNAIVIDDNGNVFVLGTSDFNFVTIRYNRVNGVVTWLQEYAGPQNQDNALDMVIKNDAVYITGFSQGTNSLTDVVTICYNRWTGILNWTQRYNGAFNGDDQGLGIKADAQGFVYVMATEQESPATLFGYSKDAIVILYSPSGKYLHKIDYNGYNSGEDEISKGMVMDATGNVYVTMATGKSGSVNGDHVKYSKVDLLGLVGKDEVGLSGKSKHNLKSSSKGFAGERKSVGIIPQKLDSIVHREYDPIDGYITTTVERYEYNANGHITKLLTQTWDFDVNAWVDDAVEQYTYDVQGRESTCEIETMDKNLGVLVPTKKYEKFYTGQSTVQDSAFVYEYDPNTASWIKYLKYIKKYNVQMVETSVESYTSDNGLWALGSKTESLFDNSGNLLGYQTFVSTDTGLVAFVDIAYVLGANGIASATLYTNYSNVLGSSRTDFTVDANGNLIQFIDQEYIPETASLVNWQKDEIGYDNDYPMSDLIYPTDMDNETPEPSYFVHMPKLITHYTWNPSGASWGLYDQEEAYYSTTLVTKTADDALAMAYVSVYPNPAKDQVTISAKGEGRLSIFNTTGDLVFERQLVDNAMVDVSGFKRGLYFYTFGVLNGKLVLE